MDTKLFASTFALIFLAELGDKTQLAALAQSVNGRWTVFLAASSALVLSTLIAVLVGEAFARAVPPAYIKGAAGVLFLLFGVLMLRSAFTGEARAESKAKPGILTSVALNIAATFEQAAADDYAALSKLATDEKLRNLLDGLQAEERDHARRIRQAVVEHGEIRLAQVNPELWPKLPDLVHDVAVSDDAKAGASAILQHALQHEEATARFYEALAAEATLPRLRAVFAALAGDEKLHASRLHDMLQAKT
ncbi:MAG TPA: TMEM165/GDT1 family protein [Planctomycetota bacterium]|jgi:rubrerythrin